MRKTICMVVQDKMVKGGIASVISGYYGSEIETRYHMIYVESYKDGGKVTKLIKAVQGYFDFVKVLIHNKPELVHIHSSFGPSFYRKLPFIYMASWAKIPIVNHIHGADFESFYSMANRRKKALIRKVYNKCDTLIALSDEWKKRFSEIVPADKIAVIENYSVPHRRAALDKVERVCNHTVLFLGEIGKRKGCYDIPEIVAETAKEVPDVKFILAGSGSEADEMEVRQQIQQKNVEKNVTFPGWVCGEEKDQLLKEADVFLLPSYNEGMPMSVLDAMGYGLPIVSTNVGGIPKIVQNGKNGYCLTAGHITEMSTAIITLLKDDQMRAAYGRRSFEIVEEKYSLGMHLQLLEQLYEKILMRTIL